MVIKESALGPVPQAVNAERLGGATAQDLRLRCPQDTEPKAGVCIESSSRSADGFLGATDRCDQVVEQLEAVLLEGGGNPSSDRVYRAVQHPFRCVALPSN